MRARAGLAAAAVFLGTVTWQGADASCGRPLDFGQLTPECSGSYCYVVTPGSGQPATLLASFWSFGGGSPSPGAGHDSGSWGDDAWLLPAQAGHFLTGDWTVAGVDGCLDGQVAEGKAAEIMVVLFGDHSAGDAFFAVASARRIASLWPQVDFTFAAGGGTPANIALVAQPRVRLTGPIAPAVYLVRGASATEVAPGIHGDGSAGAGEIVVGYRVYVADEPGGDLARSAWSPASDVVPLGAEVEIAAPCPLDGSFHVTQSIAFDSGFESFYVSAPVTVLCDACTSPERPDADADGWPVYDALCCPVEEACDCADANPDVHPGAIEICNGVDDDCDGARDEIGGLRLARAGGTTALDWPAFGDALYDVVRGDVGTLAASAGDFAQATETCLASDLTAPHAQDPLDPVAGAGWWYLVRPDGCGDLPGSYDDDAQGREGRRDGEISASGAGCP